MSFLQSLPAGDSDLFFRNFLRATPNLFAGSAFIAFGLVAGILAAIRRKFDALLIYFSLFASLYGLRILIKSPIVSVPMGGSMAFLRMSSILDFLMPIPAFLFFSATGLLHRSGRYVGYLLAAVGTSLALITCVSNARGAYYFINNVVVIFAVLVLIWDFVQQGISESEEYVLLRRGFLAFAAFALFDNIAGVLGSRLPRIEPIGFAILLGCLGYVTALRIFQRDQQLAEIQKELEVAKRIQLSVLPEAFPENPHFRVEARYVPMTSVAGDFYDYVLTEENRIGLLIADASGHGVPAAMIASMVKMAAASQRADASEPAKFLAGMNAALCGNTQGQFVTAAYVYLDAKARELRYSAAGHPPMLLFRDGQVQEIEQNGLILAVLPSAPYSELAFPLQSGDRLLLYTDGLIEATNIGGEFFGLTRLAMLLQDAASLSTSAVVDKILHTLRDWCPSQEDDLTVVFCDFARN